MTDDQLAVAASAAQTAAIVISLAYLVIGWKVLRACQHLRDSMIGMVGYRLMYVITRLVLVLVISLVISVVRQGVGLMLAQDSELRLLITLSPILVNALIIIGVLWVLMMVRGWKDLDMPDPKNGDKQNYLSEKGPDEG